MIVHLVDGTYELFRHFFAVPSHVTADGQEVAAVRGVLASMLALLDGGATHVGVATDSVLESFRNDLYDGYKSGEGTDPVLLEQFPLLEDALAAAGIVVWPMEEHEADDGLASAAAMAAADDRVEQVVICTPDKDLAQSVVGDRVVLLDRRSGVVLDELGVMEKFGVPPSSMAHWLALVGDSADGFPGLPGWGAKSASAVLARWRSIDAIPDDPADWEVKVRGAARLGASLRDGREQAELFRHIATVISDIDTHTNVDGLRWCGPTPGFGALCDTIDAPGLARRAARLAEGRT